MHSNPANSKLKKNISILEVLKNWSYFEKIISQFFNSFICSLFNTYDWWYRLQEKLLFFLLKRHFIDEFDGDRKRVDNHIFVLKYLQGNTSENQIYIDFLENEIKQKVVATKTPKSHIKESTLFQIQEGLKLQKIFKDLEKAGFIDYWLDLYSQFTCPDKDKVEWKNNDYKSLNFLVQLLHIKSIIKLPSSVNRAIEMVFCFQDDNLIDSEKIRKKRDSDGISNLIEDEIPKFLSIIRVSH
jgi:hypothetical protein